MTTKDSEAVGKLKGIARERWNRVTPYRLGRIAAENGFDASINPYSSTSKRAYRLFLCGHRDVSASMKAQEYKA